MQVARFGDVKSWKIRKSEDFRPPFPLLHPKQHTENGLTRAMEEKSPKSKMPVNGSCTSGMTDSVLRRKPQAGPVASWHYTAFPDCTFGSC